MTIVKLLNFHAPENFTLKGTATIMISTFIRKRPINHGL